MLYNINYAVYCRTLPDPDEVQQKLIDSATDLFPVGFDNSFGYGLVNASTAVR